MATGKSAPKKTAKRSAPAKKGGRKPARKTAPLPLFENLREVVSREAVGIALLVLGLFFTAAFFTGRGAFLGEAGLYLARNLLGDVGLALAPLAVVGGLLLILDRLPGRAVLGAGLLLLGVAAALAAAMPRRLLFENGAYPERGGVLGSGVYYAVDLVGGAIGTVLALALLFSLGLSLLTGIGFGAALVGARDGAQALSGRLHGLGERVLWSGQSSAENKREAPARVPEPASREKEPPSAPPEPFVPEEEPTREFEVVLPESTDGLRLEQRGPVEPGEYTPPPFSILDVGSGVPEHDAQGTSERLTRALGDLGVEARVVRAVVGPRVTRYELRLGSGVKVGKVRNLQQDIAYALAATEVRILAPIPGKSAVGVEVPNTKPAKVTLGDVFREYPDANDWTLPVGLGKDISGRAVFFDLAEMPHLLVAGTTGSGKSVMLNGLLTSLLLTTDPRQVKMVLIDPKRVELSPFGRVPHLITPVVTDVKKAANALQWAVAEMERRYEVLERMGSRSLEGYNLRSETQIPYVVIVIDELADLMMQAGAKVEDAIVRLAQKARAVGIHLVVATQRPSVDVITGMIKANVPSRVAFAVSSQVDSRVIMDAGGAEVLLGMGDMLFKPVSALRPSRVQGAFISENEVERVVSATEDAAAGRAEPHFVEEVTQHPKGEKETPEEPDDELLQEAASFVVSTQQASVSAVQRRFRVGYSRAGRIIDALERKGIVGPYEGSKSRAVVASAVDVESMFEGGEAEARAGGQDDEGW